MATTTEEAASPLSDDEILEMEDKALVPPPQQLRLCYDIVYKIAAEMLATKPLIKYFNVTNDSYYNYCVDFTRPNVYTWFMFHTQQNYAAMMAQLAQMKRIRFVRHSDYGNAMHWDAPETIYLYKNVAETEESFLYKANSNGGPFAGPYRLPAHSVCQLVDQHALRIRHIQLDAEYLRWKQWDMENAEGEEEEKRLASVVRPIDVFRGLLLGQKEPTAATNVSLLIDQLDITVELDGQVMGQRDPEELLFVNVEELDAHQCFRIVRQFYTPEELFEKNLPALLALNAKQIRMDINIGRDKGFPFGIEAEQLANNRPPPLVADRTTQFRVTITASNNYHQNAAQVDNSIVPGCNMFVQFLLHHCPNMCQLQLHLHNLIVPAREPYWWFTQQEGMARLCQLGERICEELLRPLDRGHAELGIQIFFKERWLWLSNLLENDDDPVTDRPEASSVGFAPFTHWQPVPDDKWMECRVEVTDQRGRKHECRLSVPTASNRSRSYSDCSPLYYAECPPPSYSPT